MLYITTRSKHDAHTAHRTICSDLAPDGGMYVPFKMASMDRKQLMELAQMGFSQCVAETLNRFFGCNLSGWDVEFSVGRYPAKLVDVNPKVIAAQTWHNQIHDYVFTERMLAMRICGEDLPATGPSNWVKIAIRIAFLTAIFAELIRKGLTDPEHPMDVAVPAGDFSVPMSVWYAKQMGLPIANIICGCDDDGSVWDLLHLGAVKTTKDMPAHLERLICGALGHDEAFRFSQACELDEEYSLLPMNAEKLRKGMFAAVVSSTRLSGTIHSLYRTNDYVLGPAAALAYSGLLDYRAKTGENRQALLLAERSPICDREFVAKAMNITELQLKELLK